MTPITDPRHANKKLSVLVAILFSTAVILPYVVTNSAASLIGGYYGTETIPASVSQQLLVGFAFLSLITLAPAMVMLLAAPASQQTNNTKTIWGFILLCAPLLLGAIALVLSTSSSSAAQPIFFTLWLELLVFLTISAIILFLSRKKPSTITPVK